jgi:hypothetical protein
MYLKICIVIVNILNCSVTSVRFLVTVPKAPYVLTIRNGSLEVFITCDEETFNEKKTELGQKSDCRKSYLLLVLGGIALTYLQRMFTICQKSRHNL